MQYLARFVLALAIPAYVLPAVGAIVGEYPVFEFVVHESNIGGEKRFVADVLADQVLSASIDMGPYGVFSNIVDQGPIYPAGLNFYSLVLHDPTNTYGLVFSIFLQHTLVDLLQAPILSNQVGPPSSTSHVYLLSTGEPVYLFAPSFVERLTPGVPEPNTWALAAGGCLGFLVRWWGQRGRAKRNGAPNRFPRGLE